MDEMIGRTEVLYWHWLTLGVILIALEAFLPGALVLWFGLGALSVGIALLLFPDMGLIAQLAIFVALSLAGLLIGRSFVKRLGQDELDQDISRRASYLIGQRAIVEQAIVNGVGKVRIGDSPWRAEGPDLAAGAFVMIEAVDGATVRVATEE